MNSPGEREPLFPESEEEKRAREEFYAPGWKQNPDAFRMLSVGASGTMESSRPLRGGEAVTVTVADADGEIIASGEGKVKGVGFNEHEKKGIVIVERKHKIKLGE